MYLQKCLCGLPEQEICCCISFFQITAPKWDQVGLVWVGPLPLCVSACSQTLPLLGKSDALSWHGRQGPVLGGSEIWVSGWEFQEISSTSFWTVQKGFSGRGFNPAGRGVGKTASAGVRCRLFSPK